jgi:hypothetical protein
MRGIRLATILMLTGLPALAAWPTTGPADEPRKVTLRLAKADDESHEAATALGKSTLAVEIVGPPSAKVDWRFGYQRELLDKGQAKTDERGLATLTLKMPDVRHRIGTTLAATGQAVGGTLDLDILPADMLGDVKQSLKAMRLGVVDPSGRVQAALAEQNVEFEELKPQVARDFFDGGAVIFAGFDDAAALRYELGKFEGRTRGGMITIVLNPPARWKAFGLRQVELHDAKGRPRLAEPLGRWIREADLRGDIRSALRVRRDAEILAGLATRGAGDKDAEVSRGAVLIAARKVGKGRILAATLPQLDDVARDAVGRGVLDEIILWCLNHQPSTEKKESQP